MFSFIDVETLGFTSPLLTIQWSNDFGKPVMWNIWAHPVEETLEIIEDWLNQTWVGWNVSFDAFHINKWYNILKHCKPDLNPNPYTCMQIESEIRPADYCLRPRACLDLMVICRKGPFQHLMNFKPIVLRGVPIHRAEQITQEINSRIDFTKVPGLKMHYIIEKEDRRPGLTNIKICPKGSTSLKYIHKVIKGEPLDEETIHWGDLFDTKEFGKEYMPWGGDWADEIAGIKGFTRSQIEYGLADITKMHDVFNWLDERNLIPNRDTDSELCPLVGATRWKGYSINVDLFKERYPKRQIVTDPKSWFHNYGVPTSPNDVRRYLEEVMDDNEKLLLTATKKAILESIVRLDPDSDAGKRAQQVLTERKNRHLRDMFKKLIEVGTFHPDLKVSGTLTNRMSGGNAEGLGKTKGSINPQGIDKAEWIREGFTFAYEGEKFSGGDFDQFEISVMDAVWGDETLHRELLMGKKMIALFGTKIYGLPYDVVLESKKEGDGSYYDRAKRGFYLRAYGGQAKRASQTFNLSEEETIRGLNKFDTDYIGIMKANEATRQDLTFLDEWDWREPKPYQETILGYKRYFILEQEIARAMYKLVNDLPMEWLSDRAIFRRREKAQETWQVIRSALFGCLLGLQARVIRIAGNVKIQSPGAEITKIVQEAIWAKFQPVGVAGWFVRPMNVHDEINCVHKPELSGAIKDLVNDKVHSLKKHVPLLAMKWQEGIKSWAEK